MKKICLLFLWVQISLAVNATTVMIDGIWYNLVSKDHVAEVTRNSNYKYTGTINIPEKIVYLGDEYSVTSIGQHSFSGCSGLTSVTLPNSIISIGESAFWNCTSLTNMTIPNNVKTIGPRCFEKCISLSFVTIPNSVISIGIRAFDDTAWYENQPNGLVYAGKIAYKYKGEMPANTNISIMDGSLGIAGNAFSGCNGLTSVSIPNSVIIIGDVSFSGCSSLISITIPNSVTSIGEKAFDGCSSLESVAIGSGVVRIEYDAFRNCNNLTSVHITDLATWCNIHFMMEGNIYGSNPLRIAHHLYLNGKEIKDLIIPQSVTSISEYAFWGCSGLTSVTIPNSVNSIGVAAFAGCNSLTSVVSEIEKPYKISNSTFSDDIYTVAELIVPQGTKDAYQATEGWNNFTMITETANFTIDGITYEETGLAKTVVVKTVDKSLKIVDIPTTVNYEGDTYQVTSIGARAFEGRSDIEYLSIPESITSIGEYAFIDCGSSMTVNIADPESWCKMELGNEHSSPLSSAGKVLVHDIETTSIAIPDGVTYIGNYTFYQCRCITSLTIPATVGSIGSSAFEDCTGLTSLTLSDGLESIGGSAFEGCTELKILRIPSTVNTISINAFAKCTSITDVYCYAENVPTTDENAFDGTPTENSILHVPSNALEAYKSSWPWSDFKEIVALNGEAPSVKRTIHVATAGTLKDFISDDEKYQIEELTLSGELNGTDFRLIRDMAGITYKYNGRSGRECYEFAYTNGKLKSLDLTNATIVEGGNPYIETTDFTFARSLTRTGKDYAFYTKDNCISSGLFYLTRLETIQIPNSVTTIESSAFSGCSGLASITIPSSVTRIKEFAFSGCSGLTAVHISDLEAWCHISYDSEGPSDTYSSNPLHYAHHLFLNGEELKDLVIPNNVTVIAQGAFDGASNITSVAIHNRVTRVGNSAFYGCSGLTSMTIPNSVTSIGNYAFSGCKSVKDFYCYADDVPNTCEDAFDGIPTESVILHVPANAVEAYKTAKPWSDFKEIVPLSNEPLTDRGIIFTVKDDGTLEVTGLEDGINKVDILSTVTIDGKEYQVTSIGKRAFEGRDNIEYLSIPWSVTSIGELAFIDCGNNMTVNIADPEAWCKMEIGNEHSSPLSHAKKVLVYDIETDQIDIPEGVTSIGKYTFYQCQCIKSLNIPVTVISIGSSAFEGCTGLTSLSLSEGLESIGGSAFEGCTGLKNLVIPSTVNTITINAFRNCKGITDVYCYAENVPTTDENAFDGTPTEKSTLHVPANAIEAYKTSWPWSDFKEIVALTGDDPNGILAVKQSVDKENPYYDLYGRRIHQPQQKGLYIRNGKKIVLK